MSIQNPALTAEKDYPDFKQLERDIVRLAAEAERTITWPKNELDAQKGIGTFFGYNYAFADNWNAFINGVKWPVSAVNYIEGLGKGEFTIDFSSEEIKLVSQIIPSTYQQNQTDFSFGRAADFLNAAYYVFTTGNFGQFFEYADAMREQRVQKECFEKLVASGMEGHEATFWTGVTVSPGGALEISFAPPHMTDAEKEEYLKFGQETGTIEPFVSDDDVLWGLGAIITAKVGVSAVRGAAGAVNYVMKPVRYSASAFDRMLQTEVQNGFTFTLFQGHK